jgi:glutamate 5-kinase
MRIAVKLGTSTLTNGAPPLSPPLLIELARQVLQLQTSGHQVILVSSGAIAAGRERLGFPQFPKDIPAKQMLAAIGQPRLIAIYRRALQRNALTSRRSCADSQIRKTVPWLGFC